MVDPISGPETATTIRRSWRSPSRGPFRIEGARSWAAIMLPTGLRLHT